MALVVFFRAVNVGLHQRFQPSLLAKELSEFGVVNIGAAGTLVAKAKVTPAKLRSGIMDRLSFKPELMICPAVELLNLFASDPFKKTPAGKDIRLYISVLQKPPQVPLPLPLERPTGTAWQVRLTEIIGPFVLSLRRDGPKNIYANEVVEKYFGLAATTRNWNTVGAICKVLAESPKK